MVPNGPKRRISFLLGLVLLLAPFAVAYPCEQTDRDRPLPGLIDQKAEPKPPRSQPAPSGRTSEGTNLLRLPAAALQTTTAPTGERAGLKALTDGNPSTVATATAAPLDVVFGFGGATVTAERLVVTLPSEAKPGAAAANVEVLVSTVSAHAGFRSLRADPLKPQPSEQAFAFQPAAARWVLLRFTPAAGATRVALAEIAVLGHEGPPASRYAFNEAPARALDVLARLKKVSALNIAISADEASLFEDARDGRLDKWSFAEAALIASGVKERDRRKAYLARIDGLEAEARKAVAGARTPNEKGEKLLKYLHAGPLAKGYVAGQTDLSVLLDSRTYNCVSSAVLYNVLGRRLGLDVRAVEVPDHAFAVLYDGTKHADVETTNAVGFNPARDKAALEAVRKTIGFAYIPDKHRDKRREVRETGLVALIYYNHGVELTKEKRYHEALFAYFRAMSLDPESPSAVKNALAVLANWSCELARAAKYDEALQVLTTGLRLAPHDSKLLHNRKAAWDMWADSLIKAGRDDEAVAILKKAAAAVPGEAAHFRDLQVWVFVRRAEGHVKASQWEKALAVTEPGLKKLDGSPRSELRRWRAGVLLRWTREELEAKRFEQALAVLEKGKAEDPKDTRFPELMASVYDRWARTHADRQDWAGAIVVYEKGLQVLPDHALLKHNLEVCRQRMKQRPPAAA